MLGSRRVFRGRPRALLSLELQVVPAAALQGAAVRLLAEEAVREMRPPLPRVPSRPLDADAVQQSRRPRRVAVVRRPRHWRRRRR